MNFSRHQSRSTSQDAQTRILLGIEAQEESSLNEKRLIGRDLFSIYEFLIFLLEPFREHLKTGCNFEKRKRKNCFSESFVVKHDFHHGRKIVIFFPIPICPRTRIVKGFGPRFSDLLAEVGLVFDSERGKPFLDFFF